MTEYDTLNTKSPSSNIKAAPKPPTRKQRRANKAVNRQITNLTNWCARHGTAARGIVAQIKLGADELHRAKRISTRQRQIAYAAAKDIKDAAGT